ncbi:MAG: hypothetical protein JO168_23080 [Solirubrobacterales bacterium]|nr:hypothetical protein [Solirubrobacterales bacterium]MBV9714551.1 hypothetical protein [Solirubrobacterales bacterium]
MTNRAPTGMGSTLGWPIDDASPALGKVVQWLSSALDLVGADTVMLRCDTAGGETVYVENRDGRLLVSDRGETCRYLEAGQWPYRKLEIETIRRLRGAQRAAQRSP